MAFFAGYMVGVLTTVIILLVLVAVVGNPNGA